MKYMFEVTLHCVELHVPYEVQVICVLKRGSRRLETTREVYIGSGQPLADYNDEKMSMVTTVYKDKATRKLQDRIVSSPFPFHTQPSDHMFYCTAVGKLDRVDKEKRWRAGQVCRYGQGEPC